jgi:hypothetical protein
MQGACISCILKLHISLTAVKPFSSAVLDMVPVCRGPSVSSTVM